MNQSRLLASSGNGAGHEFTQPRAHLIAHLSAEEKSAKLIKTLWRSERELAAFTESERK